MVLAFGVAMANAQKKAPDYKISNVKIMSFEGSTGEFGKEIVPGDETSFFNDLDVALFVVVEVTGEAGSFEAGRMVDVVVTEGKKVKLRQSTQIGIPNEQGKYFVPVWLDRSMCDSIKITAKITGQKTVSSKVRTVSFMCGE